MNEGASKAPLVLMEQVIMALVFALAAAMCVQAFVKARVISVGIADRDHAMNICQTVAESVKACRGDLEQLSAQLGGVREGDSFVLYCDEACEPVQEADGAAYRIVLIPTANTAFCGSGTLTASSGSGKELFSMQIAWQEE